MRAFIFPLLVVLSILAASCTKEVRYSKEELLKKAQAADPTVTIVLPRSMNEGISCSNYSEGCVSGHTVKLKNLDFIAVEFGTEAEAKYAAKKIRGYYVRNWVFDDVTGEPILEEFVSRVLDAKKP
ncbi:MAG: hypothetical protein ACJ76H_11795 [Bacteriovoracaceae bacterium]